MFKVVKGSIQTEKGSEGALAPDQGDGLDVLDTMGSILVGSALVDGIVNVLVDIGLLVGVDTSLSDRSLCGLWASLLGADAGLDLVED